MNCGYVWMYRYEKSLVCPRFQYLRMMKELEKYEQRRVEMIRAGQGLLHLVTPTALHTSIWRRIEEHINKQS